MARLSFSDRFFTPPVARAIMSPLSIVLLGAATAVGIVAGLPIVAAAGIGAAAYGAKVALSVPRNQKSAAHRSVRAQRAVAWLRAERPVGEGAIRPHGAATLVTDLFANGSKSCPAVSTMASRSRGRSPVAATISTVRSPNSTRVRPSATSNRCSSRFAPTADRRNCNRRCSHSRRNCNQRSA